MAMLPFTSALEYPKVARPMAPFTITLECRKVRRPRHSRVEDVLEEGEETRGRGEDRREASIIHVSQINFSLRYYNYSVHDPSYTQC